MNQNTERRVNTDLAHTIETIRANLRRRSGKPWSVRRGSGTAYGWITITAPPARCVGGIMTPEDCKELGELLGREVPVSRQGVLVAAASDYRQEYIERSEGKKPSIIGQPYWD